MKNTNNLPSLTTEEYKMYARQLLVEDVSIEGQKKLKQAKILFIGAGGLASAALLYLTGAGIGHIGIVDADSIELSNLHRQIIYKSQDIGQYKAITASTHLQNLNPKCKIKSYLTRLNASNASDIIKNYDIVIDSTDNFATRHVLSSTCYKLHKVHIYGAVAALEGQVSVFNYQGGPNYQDIHPSSGDREINSCIERGVLGVTTGLIGLIQATEAIKIITGIGKVLSGEMLIYNSLELSFKKIKLRNTNALNQATDPTVKNLRASFQKPDYLSLKQFKTFKATYEHLVYLIDLRDPIEYKIKHLKNAINIPMHKLNKSHNLALLKSITQYKYIFIYCNSYPRAHIASTLLKQTNIPHWILTLQEII